MRSGTDDLAGPSPVIIDPKEGTSIHHPIHIGELSIKFLKSRHETNGSLDLFELTVPAHVSLSVPHLHRDYDETIIGMDGVTTWTIDGQPVQIGPGQLLHIGRGTAHAYANHHTATARMMCILTPGLVGPEYFRELAAAANADRTSGDAPNVAGIAAVMARYGIIPAAA